MADLDRTHILAAAASAKELGASAPPQQQFHSEIEPVLATAGQLAHPQLFRRDAEALQQLSATVAALTAGSLVSQQADFATDAVRRLRSWFMSPKTSLEPNFDGAGCIAGTSTATPAGVVDLLPLAELARALSFLTDSISAEELVIVQAWFTAAGQWLQDNKQASIASEAKDHRASAWILLSAAFARFTRDEQTLESCRKRFRAHTLRNQINPEGVFPQEVATPNPYRNTLFNFDLLTGACQLLSSPFDPLWTFELVDSVGLRSAAAYLYPLIERPERWRYPADAQHFRELPGRRPGLLFAGRAYDRPEYVELWQSLPGILPPDLADSFPIRQPILWTARAPHGL